MIRDQRGSAMTMVMGIAALLAMIIPVLYVLLGQSSNSQGRRAAQERYASLVRSVERQLQDPISCQVLMGGLKIPGGLNETTSITLKYYDGGLAPLSKDWVSKDGMIEIQDVFIRRTGADFNNVRLKIKGTENDLVSVPIRVYIQDKHSLLNLSDDDGVAPKAPESVAPPKRPELVIQLHANVNPGTRQIVSCFGADSVAAACEAIGGGFNISGPAAMRCQPDKICLSSIRGLVTNAGACANDPSGIVFKSKLISKSIGSESYMCVLCFEDL